MTRLLKKFPYFISYFLGYRKPNYQPKKLPQWRIYFWSFLAAWIGIALLEIIFTYSPSFQSRQVPMIIASFGASAVLVYGVLESPLAQPRNVICGQLVGSVVGVVIAQLFLRIQQNWSTAGQKLAVEWVGGATAMALALAIMQITRTVHPPGGATALIAVITPNIVDISWFYIAIVVLSSIMQVLVGCLINNIERRYPQYWWSPHVPLKLERATIVTLMSDIDRDSQQMEDVVSNNLTSAEEGRLNKEISSIVDPSEFNSITVSSSSATLETTSAIERALYILQKHVNDSRIPYVIISEGLPLIATSDLLDDSEKENLLYLTQKVNTSAHGMKKY